MKSKKIATKERDWLLVFVASILIALGLGLIVLAIINIVHFGWWSIPIGLSGLATVSAAIMSIIENNPAWILLDLIIPG